MPDLLLAFAPVKRAQTDWLVEKATELGVACLQPVKTRRTIAERVKLERLEAIAIEAAEQCGILCLPEIAPEMTLDAFLDLQATDSALIFGDEDAQVSDPVAVLRQFDPAGPLTLLIGPEGGFDEAERARLLARKNVIRLSLGPRILRADTAVVAGLAALQIAIGDWRAD